MLGLLITKNSTLTIDEKIKRASQLGFPMNKVGDSAIGNQVKAIFVDLIAAFEQTRLTMAKDEMGVLNAAQNTFKENSIEKAFDGHCNARGCSRVWSSISCSSLSECQTELTRFISDFEGMRFGFGPQLGEYFEKGDRLKIATPALEKIAKFRAERTRQFQKLYAQRRIAERIQALGLAPASTKQILDQFERIHSDPEKILEECHALQGPLFSQQSLERYLATGRFDANAPSVAMSETLMNEAFAGLVDRLPSF